MEFYKRISQTLNHKNRPVNKTDLENYALQQFNWLSYVKCYSKDILDDEFNNNKIHLLCLKKIDQTQNIDEIKLSAADKILVENYLRKQFHLFAKIEV